MAYTRTTLISKPVESNLGITEALGDTADTLKSIGSGVLQFFGQGLKAQGAQEALAAQLAAQQQAQAPKSSGISTTTLLIGGAALAGVLVFAMRRK